MCRPVGPDRSDRARGDDSGGRKAGGGDDCGGALHDRHLWHAGLLRPTPHPKTPYRDRERLTEPLPAAVQKHRDRIHRRAHLFRRLAVREAEHIPVQHGRPLLPRQARECGTNLGHPRRLLYRVLLERFRVQPPSPETMGGVKCDRGKPRARIPRDRAALKRALRVEEGRLHHVLGILMVAQFALDESDQPGVVLPIQVLDLGGHA
jgi:hypothetical protein